MKKHYTKEQLVFYFKKLMNELNRVPTIEDLENTKKYPSLTVYKERFGSWKKFVQLYGNKDLNVKKCIYCGKIVPFKKKNKMFCSARCAHKYKLEKLFDTMPPKKCIICGNEFYKKNTKNFEKRKICNSKNCLEKYKLAKFFKKRKVQKISKKLRGKILNLFGKKCEVCGFEEILEFHKLGKKCNEKGIISSIKNRNFDFIILCPNHHQMVHKGIGKLEKKEEKYLIS